MDADQDIARTVAIVIAVRNGMPHVVEAVQSALAQGPAVRSVVVVDDGSLDGTRATIAAIADSRLLVVANPGRGVSSARNAGVEASASQWLLFLDADDRLTEGAVDALLVAAHDDSVIVYGDYERIDKAGHPFGRRHLMRKARNKPSGDVLDVLLAGNIFINGGLLICSRRAFEEVGGFDKSLTLCEDWHLWCRLAAQGPVHYVARRVMDYRVHETSTMMKSARRYDDFSPAIQAIFKDARIRRLCEADKLSRLRRHGEVSLMTYCAQQSLRAGNFAQGAAMALSAVGHFPAKAPWVLTRVAGALASL